MAVLKGVRPVRLILRHALAERARADRQRHRLSLSFLLGGIMMVETIFNYPGLAKLMVDAVSTRDMPLVQACAMMFCSGYLLLVLDRGHRRHPVQSAACAIDERTAPPSISAGARPRHGLERARCCARHRALHRPCWSWR